MRPALKAATTRTGNRPQFHFIGGKGGVGKTTCAAAFAIVAAKRGARVLIASTDPAPSLGDALTVRLSTAPGRVEAAFRRPGSLHAVEIDASAVLRRWITERRATLEKIALEGTWLDRDDVDTLLNLSLPGIDEVAALLEIARLARTGRYDRIVVDTAPTGHTLRMLSMPETLLAVARVFDRMREKHRMMVEALRGRRDAAPEDMLVDDLASEAGELGALLTDGRRTHLSWVTLPEPMAVAETADALELLADRGIPVQQIVVNHITPPPVPRPCRRCNARRAFEGRAIRALPALHRAFVVARDPEPRGLTALAAIGRELQSERELPLVRSSRTSWVAGASGRRVAATDVAADRTRLLMFGGKGGVGKTTCAAAAALAAAVQWPRRQILLVSTDPATRLGTSSALRSGMMRWSSAADRRTSWCVK